MTDALTFSQLSSALWKAAWLLKGPVDAADFKTYIFPLLFFKRLLPEHVERMHGWFRDFRDVEGVARVVTLDEIAANEHNLNIPRYVEPKNEQEVLSVDEAMKRLRESAEAAFAAEERLVEILKREGLLVS